MDNGKINTDANGHAFSKCDTKVLKGIAVTLMIIHHLYAFPERFPHTISYISMYSLGGTSIEYFVGCFGKICVAIFMFLSGYGTYLSFHSSNKDITVNIANKLKKLYFSYWKVFLIFIPIGMMLKVEIISKDLLSIFYNFTAIRISYNGEWWFLTPYIVTMLLFPLFNKWIDRKSAQLFIDCFEIITLGAFIQYIIPVILQFSLFEHFRHSLYWSIIYPVLTLLPQFLMGCIVAKYNLFKTYKELFSKEVVGFCTSLFLMILVFYLRHKLGGSFDYIYAPIFIIASISVIKKLLLLYHIFEKIGEESTTIWLTHSFYCYHFCPEFIFLPKHSLFIVLWLLLICYVTAKLINLGYSKINSLLKKQNQCTI